MMRERTAYDANYQRNICECVDAADPTAERSTEASLAIAEMKLAEQGKFAPRLESVEGGADYVSASIVDSLLLRKVQSDKNSK